MPLDNTKKPTVLLMGLPNVGKSTLFNRLVGKRVAIVLDEPGVTRDFRETLAPLKNLPYTIRLIDTPGLTDIMIKQSSSNTLPGIISKRLQNILPSIDLILFVFDGKDPTNQQQLNLFNQVRKYNKPLIAVVNKSDNGEITHISEFAQLGLNTLLPLSAEHGIGVNTLLQTLQQHFEQLGFLPQEPDSEDEESQTDAIQLAIIGRPNVGKSTLINTLLGEDVQLAADMPGITRDSIDFDWEYKGRPFKLFDTAGIRRRARITDHLEKISVQKVWDVINFAHVCVLLIDATEFEKNDHAELLQQDILLLSRIIEEGRCPIIAVNKWDRIKKPAVLQAKITETLSAVSQTFRNIPTIFISALQKQGIETLLDTVLAIEKKWNVRVPTAKLNLWLREVIARTPPPSQGMRRSRLKYMTQIHARPPRFVVFCTKKVQIPESYQQFLIKQLRQTFNLEGVPVRLILRQQRNPYDDAENKRSRRK